MAPPSTGSNTSGLSVPRLKGRGQRRTGPSRLKDTTAAVEVEEMVADKENDAVDVVLPAPQPHSTAKVWRVSLAGEAEEEPEEAQEPVKAKPTRRQARGKAVLQEQAAAGPRPRRGKRTKSSS